MNAIPSTFLPQNFRMPAEWEPHQATWLSWPHNPETWAPEMLARVESIWIRMAIELSQGEEVHINVKDSKMKDYVYGLFEERQISTEQIFLHLFPTNDAWVRDHGPIFVVATQPGEIPVAITDWEYNSWGGKYPPFEQDNEIPRQVAELLDIPRLVPHMVLEGGSIEVNGAGLLLTSEACLLNPNRNPEMDQTAIEANLHKYLGVQEILWLGEGIAGDDTDGHIDDMTRFVSANRVLTAVAQDRGDPNYQVLQENLQRLKKISETRNDPFEIISLPMPKPVYHNHQPLPASYANFYIGNEVVLVPIFLDPHDGEALDILSKQFPNRRVVGLDARDLVVGLGGIHCVTQQQPRPPQL